jgi:hypothetical protein
MALGFGGEVVPGGGGSDECGERVGEDEGVLWMPTMAPEVAGRGRSSRLHPALLLCFER